MGRMIHAEMWEDDFFAFMPMFDKLLWIGLITVCADDQGRIQDHPAIIRSKAFPVDDLALTQISESINRLVDSGKVVRYIANGHKCLQIVNWWKHQKPQWAGRSNYPAPEGWADRERYHTTGNEIITTNWKTEGGYIVGYVAPKLPSDVKVKVNDDVKIDIETDPEKNKDDDMDFKKVQTACQEIGLSLMPPDIAKIEKWLESIPVDAMVSKILNAKRYHPKTWHYFEKVFSGMNKDGSETQFGKKVNEKNKYINAIESDEIEEDKTMEGKYKETLSDGALNIINQLESIDREAFRHVDWLEADGILKAIVNRKEHFPAYALAENSRSMIENYRRAYPYITGYKVIDESNSCE